MSGKYGSLMECFEEKKSSIESAKYFITAIGYGLLLFSIYAVPLLAMVAVSKLCEINIIILAIVGILGTLTYWVIFTIVLLAAYHD